MLVTSMSEVNKILLFWAYCSLHSVLKYDLVWRNRFVVPNNTRLEKNSNLTIHIISQTPSTKKPGMLSMIK